MTKQAYTLFFLLSISQGIFSADDMGLEDQLVDANMQLEKEGEINSELKTELDEREDQIEKLRERVKELEEEIGE